MQNYYVDTCVYMNLWKKEVDENKKPLWLLAKEFFELAESRGSTIFYSGFVLKELLFLISTDDYLKKREFFEDNKLFKKVILNEEEYKKAQHIKNKNQDNCSLFYIIHIILSKKTDSILVTQDKELMTLAKIFGVIAKTPQEIINH